jgi:hypothetical protein
MTDETVETGETTEELDAELDQQSQEAVTGTEEATVQEGAEQESQSNKTPAWVEKRFAEMTRARHDAERKAQQLEKDLANAMALASASASGGETTQQPASKQYAPPVNEDQRIQQAAAQLVETQRFNDRANDVYSAGVAEHQDFDESIKNLGLLGASEDFFKSIVELEDAHKVLYALGSNPEEAARILALSPLKQGRELERLASKPAPKKTGKPVSNAPDPISSRVAGGSSKSADLDNASIDDFMKARNSQARRR